jgi:hypothetical protein
MKKFLLATIAIFLLASGCNQQPAVSQKSQAQNQPAQNTQTSSLQSCAADGVCPQGFYCYNSQYGGMGPYGVVTGPQEGDLLCHKLCQTDADCAKTEKCVEKEILGGDVVMSKKFCIK